MCNTIYASTKVFLRQSLYYCSQKIFIANTSIHLCNELIICCHAMIISQVSTGVLRIIIEIPSREIYSYYRDSYQHLYKSQLKTTIMQIVVAFEFS